MPEKSTINGYTVSAESFIWSSWFSLMGGILLFSSLWIVQSPFWHLFILGFSLLVAVRFGVNLSTVVQRIIPLLLFLLAAQLLLSSYNRAILLNLFHFEFNWAEWKYILLAVERLGLPLVLVLSFQDKLVQISTIRALVMLFAPLKWFGISTEKIQLTTLMALRFIPVLKAEWERYEDMQRYFSAKNNRREKSLKQRLAFYQTTLKAMISHIIEKAVHTGDALALRGLSMHDHLEFQMSFYAYAVIWIAMGIIFLLTQLALGIVWVILSIWIILSIFSLKVHPVR